MRKTKRKVKTQAAKKTDWYASGTASLAILAENVNSTCSNATQHVLAAAYHLRGEQRTSFCEQVATVMGTTPSAVIAQAHALYKM